MLATGLPPEDGAIDSDSAWLAWLVMMNVAAPAPTELGETDTPLSAM